MKAPVNTSVESKGLMHALYSVTVFKRGRLPSSDDPLLMCSSSFRSGRSGAGTGRFQHRVRGPGSCSATLRGLILASSTKGSLGAIWQCKLLPHMGLVAGRVRSPPCHTLSFQIKLCKARRPLNFLVSRTAGPLGHKEQEVIIGNERRLVQIYVISLYGKLVLSSTLHSRFAAFVQIVTALEFHHSPFCL